MLTPEQLTQIPRTTQNNWNDFKHEDYFGFHLAEDYIKDFDLIKNVLISKHLKTATKFMCALSRGYSDIISEIENNKKLLRKHASDIIYSIGRIAKYGGMKITDASRLFGVSKDWFYRHRKKTACSVSKLGKCFRQYPNQLTPGELEAIEKIIIDPENHGKTKTTLYFDAMRKGLVNCGRSTFFKYADLVGYQKLKKKKPNDKKIGFRASRVFEWLHVDVTLVQTVRDGIQRVAFVKDNYSKVLLHHKSTDGSADSNFIRELFEETFAKYHLLDLDNPINILSDGGSENKGSLLEWINQIDTPPIVRKITANSPEFPFSNSMSESTHSIYKTEFMRRKYSLDNAQHCKDLERFMIYYNYKRFPCEHFGLTPMEVLEGEEPCRSRFKEQIVEARKVRILKNQEFTQCPVLCRV